MCGVMFFVRPLFVCLDSNIGTGVIPRRPLVEHMWSEAFITFFNLLSMGSGPKAYVIDHQPSMLNFKGHFSVKLMLSSFDWGGLYEDSVWFGIASSGPIHKI